MTLAEGESCAPDPGTSEVYRGCATPLLCDPSTLTCRPLAELGEPCVTGTVYGDTCAAGAVCDRFGSKTCVEARAVGDVCDTQEQCEGINCKDGRCQSIGLVPDGVCAPP